MNKISIIVPVYNVEKYLCRCVDSILTQELKPIQIILVDDGSTDSSGEICDTYAKAHSNIKVIHQKNSGLSAARNTGLLNSNGEYILFVDSDDYISADACTSLYECALKYKCDIVAADVIGVTNTESSTELCRKLPANTVFTGKEFLYISLKAGTCVFPAPFAMYKRELLFDNNLMFKVGIYHEDELWTPQAFINASSVVYLPKSFYLYYHHDGSISRSTFSSYKKRCIDLLETCNYLSSIYGKLDGELKLLLMDYLVTVSFTAILMGRKTDADKHFLKSNAYTKKNKLKAFLYSISPALYLRILCFLRRQPYKI